jgi:hypothetical protein
MGARGVCSTSSRSRAAFSRRYPIEGCFYLEPRARSARGFYVAWVPVVSALRRADPGRPSHVDIPSRVVFIRSRGLVPLEGFMWHGCPRCLLYVEQIPGGLLTSISHRGLFLFRAGGSPRSRVPLAWQGTRSFKCLAVVAAVLQRGRAFLGAAAARARAVGGVAGGRDRFATVAAGLCRNDGPPAVMWPLQSWWGPPVDAKERFPAVNASGASAPESSPVGL